MEKFRNKYRIPSTRLQTSDYGWNGSYFVTICTHMRICYFGIIESAVTKTTGLPKNRFGPQTQNLASIIRGYKTGVKKYSYLKTPEFKWQSRFHDHIIRNNTEYERIKKYIINNPANWFNDNFFNS